MMRLPLLLAAAGAVAIAVAGPAALGRLALMADLPGLAAPLLTDPAVKGVALYRAGHYPLARAYFDAVLFAAAGDSEARENRNLVDALIPPVIGVGNEAGRIAVKPIATPGGMPTDADTHVHGKRLDAGGLVADSAWLATIDDDPGEFLRLRL